MENLVDGVVAAAASDAAAGQVFTLSDGIGIENADFFGRYATMLGVELPVLPIDELRAMLDAAGIGAETADYFLRRGTYSIAKARRVLGWEPRMSLDEGMASTEVWLRDNGLLA